jgi:hypothetical protein
MGVTSSNRNAIEINQRSDIILSNNTITGFSRGIMILNAEQNTTVYNNTVSGQTLSGIEIYGVGVPSYAGMNVSNNIINTATM